MAYLAPAEFVTKMVDAGESKIYMATRDVLIRAYMAGAILALAAVFAITATVMSGSALVGAILFPVGFCMLYLLGFDLLTGVFVLTPLAWLDKRPGVTIGAILKNWGLVFTGNFLGALTVAFMMAFVFTYGFSTSPGEIGAKIGHIGEARTLGYAKYGFAGWMTIFMRGMLCNWMVSTGVVGDDLDHGERQGDRNVDADHAVLRHDLRALRGEHVPVPLRADAGRQLLHPRLLHLERNPDRPRQPCGRPGLHRADALLYAHQDRAQAQLQLSLENSDYPQICADGSTRVARRPLHPAGWALIASAAVNCHASICENLRHLRITG